MFDAHSMAALDESSEEPVASDQLPTLSGALTSWRPTEELMLFRATQQVRFFMEDAGLRASFSGKLVDTQGNAIGELSETFLPGHVQNGTFTRGPLDLRQILDPPPRVDARPDRPSEIPRMPLLGKLDTTLVFEAGLEIDFTAGMGIRAVSLDDGGHIIFFCASGFLTDGSQSEIGVQGVGSMVGSGLLPANTSIEPGLVFQSEAIYTLRVTTSTSRSLLPEETALGANQWGQHPELDAHPFLALPTVISTESLLMGFGAEISEVHSDGNGLYLVAKGQMFDFAEKPVGHYRGLMPMPTARMEAEAPKVASASSQSSPLPAIPFEVSFNFEDRGSITLVGNSALEKVSILEGGAQLLMVSGTGSITGGTGAFEHATGVGNFTGSTLSPLEIPNTPGDNLPFKTTYQLQILQPATIRPVQPMPTPAAVHEAAEPSHRPSSPPDPRGLEEQAARLFIPNLPPDANPRTYQLETVDRLLGKIANFLLISPAGSEGIQPIRQAGSTVGFHLHFPLHQLGIAESSSSTGGFRFLNQASEAPTARACLVVRFAPDGFNARPGVEPPPTPLDPGLRQRFVVLDGAIELHDQPRSSVGFFGTGQTFPGLAGDPDRLSMGMALVIVAGEGQLRDLPGMVCGNILLGIPGPSSFSFLIRVADPNGSLLAPRPPVLPAPKNAPALDSTFFTLLGENNTQDSTQLTFGPSGKINGAHLRQQQCFLRATFTETAGRPLQAASQLGPIVSHMSAEMSFDPTAPPPVSFTTQDARFRFHDAAGHHVGTLIANIVEARGFPTPLPGAPMPIQRGAALAPIRGGTGIFEGARGLITVINWISIFPRQVSGFFLVRLDDPTGRFREVLQEQSCESCSDPSTRPPWSLEPS